MCVMKVTSLGQNRAPPPPRSVFNFSVVNGANVVVWD